MVSYRDISKRGEESLGSFKTMNVLITRTQLRTIFMKKTLYPVQLLSFGWPCSKCAGRVAQGQHF
jgi:hypothetical protein